MADDLHRRALQPAACSRHARRGPAWCVAALCCLAALLAGCDPAAQTPAVTPTLPDPSPRPRPPTPTPAGRTYLPSVSGPPPTQALYLPSVQQQPRSGTPVYLPMVPNSKP